MHRGNYVLSFKTQSLCDIQIGGELNEITPTAVDKVLSTTGHFMKTLGHLTSGDLLIFSGGSQIWTPTVV